METHQTNCPKCSGYVISEKTIAEGQWIEYKRCLLCAWYECPPENYDLMIINRTVYNAAEKMRNRRRMRQEATRTYYGGTGR